MNEIGSTVPLILVMITTVTILWGPRWRWVIVALAVQYAAVFLLVNQVWPLSLAAVKLITGWMAGAVLGASQSEGEADRQLFSLSSRLFRVFSGCIFLVMMFSIIQQPVDWLPVDKVSLLSSLILIGMGILQLGFAIRPLDVTIGLLTLFSGFEVIYASVVTSVLVAGLLTVVTLGLALVGAYWMVPPPEEESL